MPYLDLNGERVYYALHRNQMDGVPVLLIHGAGENHLVWPIGLRRLPGTIVYAIDLPGHGKSTGMGRSTIADYVAWTIVIPRCAAHSRGRPHWPFDGWRDCATVGAHPSRSDSGLSADRDRCKAACRAATAGAGHSDFPAGVELVSEWEWGPNAPEEIKELGKQQLLTNPLR